MLTMRSPEMRKDRQTFVDFLGNLKRTICLPERLQVQSAGAIKKITDLYAEPFPLAPCPNPRILRADNLPVHNIPHLKASMIQIEA